MKTSHKCLFGGALFAAGLAPEAAQAQGFDFVVNFGGAYPSSFAQAYSGFVTGYGTTQGFTGTGSAAVYFSGEQGPYTASSAYNNYSSLTAYGYAYVGEYLLTANSSTAYGYASYSYFNYSLAQAYGYVQVAQSSTADITWDFTNQDFPPGTFPASRVFIYNWTIGAFVFDTSVEALSGSTSVQLEPGNFYAINVDATSAGAGSTSSGSISIPTPSVLATLGVAGLGLSRRRR